ncbi:MAG: DnaJ domain-containing protein [Acidobacteriota bacterium]
MDSLVALGAHLDASFTARQLRSAFRTLARRYHPDRHPSTSDAERARLARVFAELNDNHRRLLNVVVEPVGVHS